MIRTTSVLLSVLILLVAATASLADETRVIVGFKGKPDVAVLKKHGAKAGEDLGVASAMAATVDSADIAALRAEEDVAFVEEDAIAEASKKPSTPVTPPPPQEITWNVTMVWGGVEPSSVTGSGVKVAIVDTGIDMKHPDLKVVGGKTLVPRVKSYTDDNGHGTHVAGIAAALDNDRGVVGVAPGASLYAVKVLDRAGSGYYSWIIGGIDWCRTSGMDIANMSFGGPDWSEALGDACDSAWASGVLLVAAAGNEGDGDVATDEISYPACYASVLSVGATDRYDNLASWSNTNDDVEISAPGDSIYSTYKGATYATMSGTSMASPHVAGVAALIWQEMLGSLGSTSASAVRTELDTRVRDLGASGRDNGFGLGIVDYSK